ncbi:MAG: hypothetical protein E7214_08190 [Clostridium sp.]|nr:hypothetical protein [Clostridium sp.]
MTKRHKKRWTKEEEEFLKENYSSKTNKSIAKKLNRTEGSVLYKVAKMHLKKEYGEMLTFNQLAIALGLQSSYSHIKSKLIKNGFRTNCENKFTIEYFWNWAEKHKNILNFSKFETNMLGKEPSWVEEKRRLDSSNPTKINYNRVWTKKEDSLLIQKTKSNRYTYKQLSLEFNRTEAAIKRRLNALGVPYRPVPLNCHIKWTKEEDRMLIELNNKGLDSYTIAKILNKSQLGISNRIKKLRG